jgi:TRAP-type uncharacterized transport system fused permease subunit
MNFVMSGALCALLLAHLFNFSQALNIFILDEQVYLAALGMSIFIYTKGFIKYTSFVISMAAAVLLNYFNDPYSSFTHLQLYFVVLLPIVLYAVKKSAGTSFAVICAVMLIYAFTGHLWPAPLTGYSLDVVGTTKFLLFDSTAMLGTSLAITCETVFAFLLLGSILQHANVTGIISDFFIRRLNNTRGGAAKVAMCSSMAFGAVSGSAVSNVVSTGNITIPMMIKSGCSRVQAAAFEAVASTAGQVMPPILGAAAFLMASLTGIPYTEIALAATIPALLLYASIFIMIHFLSSKQPQQSFVADTRIKMPNWKDVISDTATLTSQMIILGAAVGIIIGIFDQTGITFNITSDLVRVGQENQVHILLITAVVCILLGMGMPTTTTYLLTAIFMGPILVQSGFDLLASHLFIMYYGCISMLTPPVALATMAAANIAKADQHKVDAYAMMLSLPYMIIPFIFIAWPAMLLRF